MEGGSTHVLALAGAAAALLLVRALGAALESALAAVGLARAQALAAEAGTPVRARALVALTERRESTAALLSILDAVTALGAGVVAGVAGSRALPAAREVGVALAVLAAAFTSLLLSSAGRALGGRHGEPLALALALPARRLGTLFSPVARAAGWLARPLAGGPGAFALPPPPLEELERALAEYARSGGSPSDQSTSELIQAVFEFRGKVARDVMVPRTEVVAVDVDTPVPEILRLLAEEGHSRMPVYRENLDHVVGTLHARDLVPLMEHPGLIVLRDLVRPPHFVPWSKPVDQLLREMQGRHIHMVVVVDEYGGVMGICTLEDVLEEIVGEIGDEFEAEQAKGVEVHADGTCTVRGDVPVAEFNQLAGGDLPLNSQYETVGGFLNSLAGAIPVSGDRFFHRGWLFTVSEATPRRVLKVRAARVKRSAERDGPSGTR
jgi:CBS domain containing-hemolysin-like protein